jgi:hypothetical protein
MMKYYKDADNKIYGFDSTQTVPSGLVEITKLEADVLGKQNFEAAREAEIAAMDYVRQRLTAYPELGQFVDAWVKNDTEALEEYRTACLAVKAKYPKPAGF